ncbi:hypothetical protein ACOSQ3_022759 [Xanthoceras sorbifolium]
MHEDNQFSRCGHTLLWISNHIFHRALLFPPSPSIGNNWFYCETAHDIYIDLLCTSAFSIG